MVAGVGCAQDVWENEIKVIKQQCLTGEVPLKGGISICSFDNRGIGRSTCPELKEDYSIEKMAKDCLALMNHLNWPTAHLIGHSMGSMISTRVAILAPEKVDSLTLIATARRFADLWPRSLKSLGLFVSMLFSPLDAEGRALLDLKCHFTQEYLEEDMPLPEEKGRNGHGNEQKTLKRRESLKHEYMRKASIKHNHQPDHGFKGQMYACRCHFVSSAEIEKLRQTTFPFLMIHGTLDHIIPWQAGQRFFLMMKNRSKFMLLHGAHFLSRERVDEVVNAVLQQILHGSSTHKTTAVKVAVAPLPTNQ